MNKFKIISFIFSFIVFIISGVLAYIPTEFDNIFINKVELAIDQNIKVDSNPKIALVDWFYLFENLYNKQSSGTRIEYLIKEIKSYLRDNIDIKKKDEIDLKIKSEQNLFEQYQGNIINIDQTLSDRCFKYFDIIDDWAWAYNIPTTLIIATWQIETTCNFKNYKNGLFQIISKDYGTGEMTKEEFIKQLKHLGEFINNKWNWYNNRNKDDGLSVGLSYTNINYDGIIKHGALYNGLSGYTVYGDIKPLNKNYVFGNFGQENKYKKDGLLVDILKAIQK